MMGREVKLVRFKTRGKHAGHSVACQRGARDRIHLMFGIFDLFAQCKRNLIERIVGEDFLADELRWKSSSTMRAPRPAVHSRGLSEAP